MNSTAGRPLYIFLDEGGNFDFSSNGTKYFTLTGVSAFRPFPFDAPLLEQRFDLIEAGFDIEYFHASDDHPLTRERVLSVIEQCLELIRIDTIIVEKRKVDPADRDEMRFYPEMLGHLLWHIFDGLKAESFTEVIVITDRIPVNKKRNAIEKAIKQATKPRLARWNRYRLLHHDSKSCGGLQIADYANWAIYRLWDRAEAKPYARVQRAVASQIEIFAHHTILWY